jgi:RNA polymerase sigma-70 factor (ECF subfamily)
MSTQQRRIDCARLVARALAGDEESERELYSTYHSAAYRLAYLLLSDTRDADEVVQDAFVYALTNLERYDEQRGSFWAWLRVIVVSRCRNKRRRRELLQVSLDTLGEAAMARLSACGDDPARHFEATAMRQALWDALLQVSSGARDALVLRFYEGLSYAEIANVLGCSSEAARSRVAHGKAQLRRLLAQSSHMDRRWQFGPLAPREVG